MLDGLDLLVHARVGPAGATRRNEEIESLRQWVGGCNRVGLGLQNVKKKKKKKLKRVKTVAF
jgi:hypothetical protein